MNTLAAATAPSALSTEDEARLIRTAQDRTNPQERECALAALWDAYQPVLNARAAKYRDHLEDADLQQEMWATFLEVIDTHDAEASPRLAGRISQMLCNALDAAASAASTTWAIPTRTLQRFHGILRRGEGDIEAGAKLAPQYQMPAETFLWIAHLLRATESLHPAAHNDEGEREHTHGTLVGTEDRDVYADADDHILAQAALAALSDHQREIVEMAYGFRPVEIDGVTIDPVVPDRLIGVALGKSRLHVLRQRNAALATMRDALGL